MANCSKGESTPHISIIVIKTTAKTHQDCKKKWHWPCKEPQELWLLSPSLSEILSPLALALTRSRESGIPGHLKHFPLSVFLRHRSPQRFPGSGSITNWSATACGSWHLSQGCPASTRPCLADIPVRCELCFPPPKLAPTFRSPCPGAGSPDLSDVFSDGISSLP